MCEFSQFQWLKDVFWYLYGRSFSFPGFSPNRRGRVGENPGNEAELCTAKYCLLLKAFEKKKIVFN